MKAQYIERIVELKQEIVWDLHLQQKDCVRARLDEALIYINACLKALELGKDEIAAAVYQRALFCFRKACQMA